jgi:MoaA/NifB/PqqE/SkfB family radical SAM enzyme
VAAALRLGLYGGEPLLNPDVFAMVRTARRRGYLVTVSTNGTLLDRCLADMQAARPDALLLSYHAAERERLAPALSALAETIPLRLHFTITEDRLGEIEDCCAFAARVCARWVFLEHMCPRPAREEPARVAADDPRLVALREKLTRAYGGRLVIRWPRIGGARAAGGLSPCRSVWNTLHINALGQSAPCCVWPTEGYEGDVFRDEQSWNASRMVELRRQLRRGEAPGLCRDCPCLYDDSLGL